MSPSMRFGKQLLQLRDARCFHRDYEDYTDFDGFYGSRHWIGSSSEIFEREVRKVMRIVPLTREYLKEFEKVRLKSIKVFGRLRPTLRRKTLGEF